MDIHVTNSYVIVAILTQYSRIGSSLIHLGSIYTACDLGAMEITKLII